MCDTFKHSLESYLLISLRKGFAATPLKICGSFCGRIVVVYSASHRATWQRNADWFYKIQDCIRSDEIATSLKPPILPLLHTKFVCEGSYSHNNSYKNNTKRVRTGLNWWLAHTRRARTNLLLLLRSANCSPQTLRSANLFGCGKSV